MRATPDSLTIEFPGQSPPVTLPVHAISRLDVSRGKRLGVGVARGAGLGLLIGRLLGTGIGATDMDNSNRRP